MLNLTVTKRFHRAEGDRLPGDVVTMTLPFADIDAAIEWGENVNKRWEDHACHVTGVYLDSRNFCMFSMRELSEQMPGYDNLGWNEVDPADAPSEQELFEMANGAFLYSDAELSRHAIKV